MLVGRGWHPKGRNSSTPHHQRSSFHLVGIRVSSRKGQLWGKNVQNVEKTMGVDFTWPAKMYTSNARNQTIWSENALDTSHLPLSCNVKKEFLPWVLEKLQLQRSWCEIRDNLGHGLAFSQPCYVKLFKYVRCVFLIIPIEHVIFLWLYKFSKVGLL